MTDQLKMFDQTTCEDSCSATSLPVSADGLSPCSLPDGQQTEPYGLDHAHASPSVSQAHKKDSTTPGISGQCGENLSASAALQKSMESKLRVLLNGSDLCEVNWKVWITPWGQCLSKPRARVRTTYGTAIGLWPTVTANPSNADGVSFLRRKGRKPTGAITDLGALTISIGLADQTEKPGALNPEFVCWLMGFPQEWVKCAPLAMPSTRQSRQPSSKQLSDTDGGGQ